MTPDEVNVDKYLWFLAWKICRIPTRQERRKTLQHIASELGKERCDIVKERVKQMWENRK